MRAGSYAIAIVPGLLLLSAAATEIHAAKVDEGENGRQLAERLCARCHAIGKEGDSPFKPAPPFRDLVEKWPDTEVLAEALAEGISVGHPAMPEFVLEPDEIGELLSYLETLKD